MTGINIFDPGAFAKLAAMEGPMWVRAQQNEMGQVAELGYTFSENSFVGALLRLGDGAEAVVIYGAGGWHRYSVGADGEIWFLRHFCPSEERLEQARQLGFNIG